MAYSYDYLTLTQHVYVNGVLDASNSPRGPYIGTAGNMTIGTNKVFFPLNYWDGCIDQVSYFSRTKNASEILSDATLTVAYTFNNTLSDSRPLGINGTGTSLSYTASGRISGGLSSLTSGSYVQAQCLVLLTITYESSNGLRLWMNGTQFAASCNYSATDVSVTLTMGASLSRAADSCTSGIITTGQYFGFLDESQLFSRELSLTEVWSLANP
ncbi:unnamed protein product [Rotaria magnacalcarata]|nr:unnamed protein product [Rotaria magnacalcarata]